MMTLVTGVRVLPRSSARLRSSLQASTAVAAIVTVTIPETLLNPLTVDLPNIGAVIVSYTILVVPYCKYSRMGPKALF